MYGQNIASPGGVTCRTTSTTNWPLSIYHVTWWWCIEQLKPQNGWLWKQLKKISSTSLQNYRPVRVRIKQAIMFRTISYVGPHYVVLPFFIPHTCSRYTKSVKSTAFRLETCFKLCTEYQYHYWDWGLKCHLIVASWLRILLLTIPPPCCKQVTVKGLRGKECQALCWSLLKLASSLL